MKRLLIQCDRCKREWFEDAQPDIYELRTIREMDRGSLWLHAHLCSACASALRQWMSGVLVGESVTPAPARGEGE